MKRPLRLFVIFFVFLGGCLPDECDINELQKANDITKECRAAIEDALPSATNNLSSLLLPMGIETSGGSTTLYFIGSGVGSLTTDDLTLTTTGGGEVVSDVLTFDEISTDLLSASFIFDYSGSMREQDIRDSAKIADGFISIFGGMMEGEVIQFRHDIKKAQSFTSDMDVLSSAVDFDPTVERTATALYDGIGKGLADVAERNYAIRTAIVFTDGRDNSSAEYSQSDIYEMAQANNTPVIIFGSLFSSVDTLQRIAKQTNGLYFYAPNFTLLKSAAEKLMGVMANMQAITFTGGSGTVQLTYKGKTATMDMP